MLANFPNLNSYWAYLIIEEFIRLDRDYFILSPGSRCTPLTVAVANHPKARKIIVYDERSAAFHALGYAHATGKSAILICTSGTAAANYYPAVIEATSNHLPLIILSADRPPELQQTGANQTIKQDHLYGQYIKHFFNLPCPTQNIVPSMVLTTIDQAVYQNTKGVVHLNCHFREPLAPTPQKIDLDYFNLLQHWQNSGQPYTQYSSSIVLPQDIHLSKIANILNQTQSGILAIGHLRNFQTQEAILELAQHLNWPIFADIQSGLRLNSGIPQLIFYFDQILCQDNFTEIYSIETVLQIGDRIISQRFNQWLKKANLKHYIVVTNNAERHDAEHIVSYKIESHISSFCQILTQKLLPKKDNRICQKLQQQSQEITPVINDFILQNKTINEPAIAHLISRYIPQHHGLFLANSMAVREMDMYGIGKRYPIKIAANRGTSGIEGTIASATGFLTGLKQPVTLLIGDLALLHDLNSLSLLTSLAHPLTIVLINNDGGGIFSFLPIAEFSEIFEPYFGTPHGHQFRSAAELFNLNYYQPQTIQEFIDIYTLGVQHDQPSLIEVITHRDTNYQLHQQLQRKIQETLTQKDLI